MNSDSEFTEECKGQDCEEDLSIDVVRYVIQQFRTLCQAHRIELTKVRNQTMAKGCNGFGIFLQ